MKTIVVNDETHAELKSWGEFGESFEDVIKKLMKCCKEKEKILGENSESIFTAEEIEKAFGSPLSDPKEVNE
jgi:predicted CopG family antitoxin